MRSSAFFISNELVNQEYLRQTLPSGLDSSTTLDDGTDFELHFRIVGGSRESRALTQLAVHLIAGLIGIAVEIG